MFLGIDTSNYRTSVCLMDADGSAWFDRRVLFPVPQGGLGARQSEAVFFHVRTLGALFEELRMTVPRADIRAIAVSTRPRPAKGSYMPVFEVGRAFARSLGSVLGVPVYETTHQEGHIAACEKFAERVPFWVFHLSGGTSELLDVAPRPGGYAVAVCGGTRDVTVGQLIDRIGVALGCPFPAGPCVEALARESVDGRESGPQKDPGERTAVRAPVRAEGPYVHLSGTESALLRAIDDGADPAEVARAAERAVAKAIEKVVRAAASAGGVRPLYLVGGVAANAYIRDRLEKRLGPLLPLRFAAPEEAGDNACGVARIARERWRLKAMA